MSGGHPLLLRRELRTRDRRPLLIRPASSADAPALVALRDAVAAEGRWVAAVPGEQSEIEARLLLASLLSHGGLALCAEVGSGLCGHLTVSRPAIRYQAHLGELALLVAADARGVGVGSALLETAVDWARATGVAKLWLGVFADNRRAIGVYERAGFVEEGRQPDQVRVAGEGRELVLMGLRL